MKWQWYSRGCRLLGKLDILLLVKSSLVVILRALMYNFGAPLAPCRFFRGTCPLTPDFAAPEMMYAMASEK